MCTKCETSFYRRLASNFAGNPYRMFALHVRRKHCVFPAVSYIELTVHTICIWMDMAVFYHSKTWFLSFFFSYFFLHKNTSIDLPCVQPKTPESNISTEKLFVVQWKGKKKQNRDSYDWIHRALVDWVVLLAVSNQILFISNINHWNLITSTMKFLSFMPEHMHDLFQIYRLADVYNKKQRSKKHWFCLSNELFFLLSICLKAQSQVNIAIVAFIQFYWKYEKQ